MMTKPPYDMTLGEYMYTAYVRIQWLRNGLWFACWEDLTDDERDVWNSLAKLYPDTRTTEEYYG